MPRFRDNFTPIYKTLMRPHTTTVGSEIFAIATWTDIDFARLWFLHHSINPVGAGVIKCCFFAVEMQPDLRLRVG